MSTATIANLYAVRQLFASDPMRFTHLSFAVDASRHQVVNAMSDKAQAWSLIGATWKINNKIEFSGELQIFLNRAVHKLFPHRHNFNTRHAPKLPAAMERVIGFNDNYVTTRSDIITVCDYAIELARSIEKVKAVRAILQNPELWSSAGGTKNSVGQLVPLFWQDACSRGLVETVWAYNYSVKENNLELTTIYEAVQFLYPDRITGNNSKYPVSKELQMFNYHKLTTHADILYVLDWAIEQAKTWS